MNKQAKSIGHQRRITTLQAICASLIAFSAQLVHASAAELSNSGAATWESLNTHYPKVAIRNALQQQYQPASFPAGMLWHNDGELSQRGEEALDSLLLAELRGLPQQGLNQFTTRVRNGQKSAAAADWLITARLLQLNRRLEGINRSQFSSIDASSFHQTNPDDALADIVATARPVELLKIWRPNAPGFARLSDMADRYEQMQAWPVLTGSGVLSAGDRDSEVIELKRRLASEGFKPTGDFDSKELTYTALYSGELATQLEKYQTQRGLKADGVLGPNTRSSLNISPADRAVQLRLNLARLKSLPADLGEHYVWVNIPEYKARIIRNGETDFETRVVVGKKQHKTPMFIDHMDYLEVNPYWNIPRSIVTNEIAPSMVQNPNHIDEKDMEILSGWSSSAVVVDPSTINWRGIANGSESLTFRIRQRPGNQNALGRVKFIFPNNHNVYLHDTPQDALFDRNKRNFSHGCVRLHKPFEMAEYVLSHRRDEPTDFRELLRSKETTRLQLDQPLPVYLVYFTTWVDDQGELQIRNDVYGHDRRLADELKQERDQLVAAGDFDDVIALEDKLIPYLALNERSE